MTALVIPHPAMRTLRVVEPQPRAHPASNAGDYGYAEPDPPADPVERFTIHAAFDGWAISDRGVRIATFDGADQGPLAWRTLKRLREGLDPQPEPPEAA
jgi:hypothetical protein